MNSSALQSPSDPDATCRNEAGKLYKGYAASIEETAEKNGSVVADYQFDKNTLTDNHFLQKSLSAMEKSTGEIILVTDGWYNGHEPLSQTYTKNTRQCKVSLDRNHCADCPYIRKNYHLEKLPRGKQRGKFFWQ